MDEFQKTVDLGNTRHLNRTQRAKTTRAILENVAEWIIHIKWDSSGELISYNTVAKTQQCYRLLEGDSGVVNSRLVELKHDLYRL